MLIASTLVLVGLIVRLRAEKLDYGLLKNVKFGKCLHLKTPGSGAGTGFDLATCNPADDNQRFNVKDFTSWVNTPGPILLKSTGYCLSVSGEGNGAPIHQYPFTPSYDNQKWRALSEPGGETADLAGQFLIQSVYSKACLTAEGQGEYVDQWACSPLKDAPHQYWTIDASKPPPQSTPKPTPQPTPKPAKTEYCYQSGRTCNDDCCDNACVPGKCNCSPKGTKAPAVSYCCGFPSSRFADGFCANCTRRYGECTQDSECCPWIEPGVWGVNCEWDPEYKPSKLCVVHRTGGCLSPGEVTSSGMKCCSGRTETEVVPVGEDNGTVSKCTCASKGYLCKSNGDCCDGKCDDFYYECV